AASVNGASKSNSSSSTSGLPTVSCQASLKASLSEDIRSFSSSLTLVTGIDDPSCSTMFCGDGAIVSCSDSYSANVSDLGEVINLIFGVTKFGRLTSGLDKASASSASDARPSSSEANKSALVIASAAALD